MGQRKVVVGKWRQPYLNNNKKNSKKKRKEEEETGILEVLDRLKKREDSKIEHLVR